MSDQGVTPESWACVDCGINTWPGFPTRVEIERRYNTLAASKTLSANGRRASPCKVNRQ